MGDVCWMILGVGYLGGGDGDVVGYGVFCVLVWMVVGFGGGWLWVGWVGMGCCV